MISNEVLSAVLNLNMWKTDSLNIVVEENEVFYTGLFLGDSGYQQSSDKINLYELAHHKCKEWANTILDEDENPAYVLTSKTIEVFDSKFSTAPVVGKAVCYIGLLVLVDTYGNSGDMQFKHYTQAEIETEAIFKACQWLLNLKNKMRR